MAFRRGLQAPTPQGADTFQRAVRQDRSLKAAAIRIGSSGYFQSTRPAALLTPDRRRNRFLGIKTV